MNERALNTNQPRMKGYR